MSARGARVAGLSLLVVLGAWDATVARAQQHAVRIDGLAAVVGGEAPGPGVDVVLRSDVELRARVALAGRTRGALPLSPIPRGLLEATLQQIVGELLIAREARRVQAAEPTAAAIAAERARLARAAGGQQRLDALMQALGASSEEIDDVATRRALVAAFLNANLEGATVVTDAEVDRAYRALEQPEGDPAQVRAALRRRLARAALDRTIERWVNVLRTRTPVRIYADY